MPNWFFRSLKDLPMKEQDKLKLIRIMGEFYCVLYKKFSNSQEGKDKTKSLQYKEEVLEILKEKKASLPLSEEELIKIQMLIEDKTMKFDEESMFKTASNIIKILIKPDDINAKDYLRKRVLTKEDMELLSEFGQYTLEALIVYVLGQVFNPLEKESRVRVASLVERLESRIRTEAFLLKSRRCKQAFSKPTDNLNLSIMDNQKRSKLELLYPLGSGLVQFMEDRHLISLESDKGPRVMRKKGSYFLPSNLFAVSNFDISLLPIKLNLPMVCPPIDWKSTCPNNQSPRTLSDLSGGYLSTPTGDIYDRYRLLSSGDIHHFYIDISHRDNYKNLCNVMNKLQRQAFKINSDFLNFLHSNEQLLVKYGYLMPRFLSSINLKEVSILLRDFYMKDEVLNQLCSFSEFLKFINKDIQRSRYERFIINLATAYDGYQFYLPAFLDFRGRIYRSGILHFHERDLARSLIVFADFKSKENSEVVKDNLMKSENSLIRSKIAAAFHYKSFDTFVEATHWFDTEFQLNSDSEQRLFGFILEAKRPFQFLANFIGIRSQMVNYIPVVQDASASAYQIMSYFLLDETMAKRTNLIPSSDGKIQDVYSFFLEELKEFMKAELGDNLSTIVCRFLTRKLVKSIFMPIIYGKTLMSTAGDLKDLLSHYLTHKECFEVASVCFKFWRSKYHGMECLIRLIRHIGWIAAARNRPVFYKVPYFTTVQDYMIMDSINIWLYDRLHKKRRRVTLKVSSSKRDRRKTEISTFVNFIHQKDAQIAMSVVETMLSLLKAPIYTVHDNFITTAEYSELLPMIYSHVFRDMGPPLSIINRFIYMNVIKPIVKRESESEGPTRAFNPHMVISKEMLHHYLKENIPDKINKKMMATWEERISGILTSYENYTRIVCGDFHSSKPRECWSAHEQKWAKFQLKLISRDGIPNYSVHY